MQPSVRTLISFRGTIPPNPTELVARDTLEKAIGATETLGYDYVLLDTALIGMVTDTATLSRVAGHVCLCSPARNPSRFLLH